MPDTATRAYEVRRATEADTDRILDLVKLSLGEGVIPRSREYWHWKHYENPFGESPMLVAESGGEFIGLRVFMRWQWTAGEETYNAVRAVDTATHPDWRGKGIFSKLTRRLVNEMRDEGVHFIFNTPNGQSMPGYLKMGWETVGRTDVWIKPLRPFKVLRAFAGKRMSADYAPGNGSRAALETFKPAERFFSDIESFAALSRIRSSSTDLRLGTPLHNEYLRWRYADIPGFDYFAAAAREGDHAAVAFFRFKPQGELLELRIGDLLVDGSRGSLRLGRRVVREIARTSGADYISAMASSHTPYQRVLWRSGFLPGFRLGPTLTVNTLNPHSGLPGPTRRESWRLTTGALELF